MRYRHVALFAGAHLQEAEGYYSHLFGLDVVLREGPLQSGGPNAELWGQLPPDKTWDDADAAGVDIGMVALQRDDVILALFAAEPTGERFYAVGLVMVPDEIDQVAERLDDEMVENRSDGWLAFIDRFGVRWQLSSTAPFRGAGTTRGSWLDV